MNRNDLIVVSLLYLASTALYAALGVRFDAHNLDIGMHFIDTHLLRDRLLCRCWSWPAGTARTTPSPAASHLAR